MTHGSLFSGIGGFELGALQADIPTLWSCEIEEFNRKILKQHFPNTIQYNDIRELHHPKPVDIISGGFPCQDLSIAGKGKGLDHGERSGLWSEMYRIIDQVRPSYVVIENSPELLKKGFEKVLYPLSEIGYDAEWQCLSGTTFGIQQGRERVYCIAYAREILSKRSSKTPLFRQPDISKKFTRISPGWRKRSDLPEPRTIRKSNGVPNLVDRIGSIGNAVQPRIANYIFHCISKHAQHYGNTTKDFSA